MPRGRVGWNRHPWAARPVRSFNAALFRSLAAKEAATVWVPEPGELRALYEGLVEGIDGDTPEAILQERAHVLFDRLDALTYHVKDSRFDARRGFPDLPAAGHRTAYLVELKAHKNHLKPEQRAWAEQLAAADTLVSGEVNWQTWPLFVAWVLERYKGQVGGR